MVDHQLSILIPYFPLILQCHRTCLAVILILLLLEAPILSHSLSLNFFIYFCFDFVSFALKFLFTFFRVPVFCTLLSFHNKFSLIIISFNFIIHSVSLVGPRVHTTCLVRHYFTIARNMHRPCVG